MSDPFASSATFRVAVERDVPEIVALLADDVLGSGREPGTGELDGYRTAFASIAEDDRHRLVVGEVDGRVVAVLQLSLLPTMTHGGRTRAQIEGVRVAAEMRGSGVGRALLDHAIAAARAAGCGVVQLTTDKQRADALRFYESLGFVASHEGLKLTLV